LTPPEVAEELNVKLPQVRALLRSGELRGVQIGGRGVWRIERAELERYIAKLYDEAQRSAEDEAPRTTDAGMPEGPFG
jgi:excisionase family DNA binding protein